MNTEGMLQSPFMHWDFIISNAVTIYSSDTVSTI